MNLETLQLVSKYATPEVFTVIGAIVTAWLGWKVTSKGLGLVGALAQKASFLGLVASVMFITGVGTMGLGVGELATRWTNSASKPDPVGVQDSTLSALAEKCHDKGMAKLVLDYARIRDNNYKNDNARTLYMLIEKQLDGEQSTKDRAESNKLLMEYISFLKTCEIKKDSVQVVSATNDPVNLKTQETETASAKENKDSLLSIPISLALLGVGFGTAICAVVCHNRRQRELGQF